MNEYGTNQPTKDLTEGGDLRGSAIRHPSVCVAISALTALAGLSNRHLKL